MFGEPNIPFEDGQAVWRALQAYRKTRPVIARKDKVIARKDKKEADFADALIVFKADAMAAVSGTELKGLYTFDVAARQLPLTAAP
ncbi:MAG: hypothetical protein O7F73_13455 [Gammaproteobacteria bacterium]|nr:hypothetical protein [Gammaproteobacteria bacterium]